MKDKKKDVLIASQVKDTIKASLESWKPIRTKFVSQKVEKGVMQGLENLYRAAFLAGAIYQYENGFITPAE